MARYERKDRFYRKAKQAGLRSRAAFKLEDLAAELIRPGDRVLDLGCWPGGWLQVAARRVGESGRVVGVDLDPVRGGLARNVRFVQGDAADETIRRRLREELGAPADVVLSDMAPKLTGIRVRDQAMAERVADLALGIAREVLDDAGRFVCKIFMTPAHREFLADVRRSFANVTTRRSGATRKGSSELYVVATNFRGDPRWPGGD